MESGESQTEAFCLGYYPDEETDDCELLAHVMLSDLVWTHVKPKDLDLMALEAFWIPPVDTEGTEMLLPPDILLFNGKDASEYMIDRMEERDPEKTGKIFILDVKLEATH